MIAEAAAKEGGMHHPPTTIHKHTITTATMPSILPWYPVRGRYVENVGTLKTSVLQTEFFSKR